MKLRQNTHPTKSTRAGRPASRIGLSLALMFGWTMANAQSSQTPEYISSMADFEVRALAGNFQPTNGKETMESVTPNEWLANDPGIVDLAGTIVAWSGGPKASAGTKLFVHGGGHNDSANNGLYAFDFAGSAAPTGWLLEDISAVSAVRAATSYNDGKPASVHTYDGAVYAQHNNHIYRFGGAIWSPSGGFTKSAWKYNIASGAWTALPDFPGTMNTVSSIYDPESRKIIVGAGGRNEVAFFRTDQDTWSSLKSTNGNFWGGDVSGAYDPTRGRGVLIGNGESRLVTINWSRETVDVSSLSASGATEILSTDGPSAVYDPFRDSYWIFGGEEGSPGFGNIYEMDAESLTIQRRSLSGASIQVLNSMQGSYGRYLLMPEWRAMGIVASHESPAYVIKLPTADASPIVRPLPPSEVATDQEAEAQLVVEQDAGALGEQETSSDNRVRQ